MHPISYQIVQDGARPAESPFPAAGVEPAVISLAGVHRRVQGLRLWEGCCETPQVFSLVQKSLAKGVLVTGAARSGKSNVIMKMVQQAGDQLQLGDRMVIFDVKGEYVERFGGEHPVCLGAGCYDHCWNLYRDILAHGTDADSIDLHTNELCSYLFEGQKGGLNPFFVHAASHIVSCVIRHNIRHWQETGDSSTLNNRALKNFLLSAGRQRLLELLLEYEDFHGAASYLGGERADSPMTDETQGVCSEIQVMVQRVFVGAFGQKGDFSPVEFIKNGSGKLFLMSDPAIADTVNPILRYFIDSMLATLSSRNTQTNRVYFVIDEFAQLPEVRKLATAMSLLSFKNVSVIIGIQSVEQMFERYSEAAANNQLDLFQTMICLRATPATAAYAQKRFGTARVSSWISQPDGSVVQDTQYRPAAEDYELQRFDVGEAYVLAQNQSFWFKFNGYGY